MQILYNSFLPTFLHSLFYAKSSLCSQLSHAIVLIVHTFSGDYQCRQSSTDPSIRPHFRHAAILFVSRGLFYSYFKTTTETRRKANIQRH